MPRKKDGDWTLLTLKAYFDALRAEDHKAIDAAFEAAKEKSASHNELIQAMERQQATFITKGNALTAVATALTVIGLFIAYFGGSI